MRPVSRSLIGSRATVQSSRLFTAQRFYSSETEKKGETEQEKELGTETEEKDQISELQVKLESKDKEAAELKDLYIRSVADFRNLQETTKREIQKAKDFALQKFAKDLIESIDNFTHALNAVDEKSVESNDEIKNLYEGVEMTRNIFVKTLERHGLKEIEAIGEKFDPNKHEATFEVPQPDKEPGTVFHVQQPGYELNGRVLRAAKVGIVKGSE